MIGRHVDEAGAGVAGDELARQERPRLGEEAAEAMHRMLRRRAFQHRALHQRDELFHLQASALHERTHQVFLDEEPPAAAAEEDVIERRIIGERLVDGNRPRRRRPDDRGHADQDVGFGRMVDLEPDVDLGRDDVLIFDFGFGQRGLFDRRPHDGLGAAVQLAAFGEFQQLADDRRLGVVIHREIGVGPVAHHAKALELVALHTHPFVGIGAAFGAELRDRHLILILLLGAIRLFDLPFDRQAVAVPAGHIGGILAHQRLAADDDVLQHLVHRMAHVDVAVGIGRAVVKNEQIPALTLFAQAIVHADPRPALQDRGLLRGEARLHRKVGLRQEDGVAPIFGSVGRVAHRSLRLSGKV